MSEKPKGAVAFHSMFGWITQKQLEYLHKLNNRNGHGGGGTGRQKTSLEDTHCQTCGQPEKETKEEYMKRTGQFERKFIWDGKEVAYSGNYGGGSNVEKES